VKRIALTVLPWFVACFVSLAPALAKDGYTGVPVYPGVTDHQPTTASLTCPGNLHMRVSLYLWSASAADSPARIASWYQSVLRGSSIAHHEEVHVLSVVAADGSSGAYVSRAGGMTMLRLYRLNPPAGKRDLYGTNCKRDN
jgi:hypothetical protein